MRLISPETIGNVKRAFVERLSHCQTVNGGHFEHLLGTPSVNLEHLKVKIRNTSDELSRKMLRKASVRESNQCPLNPKRYSRNILYTFDFYISESNRLKLGIPIKRKAVETMKVRT
ncbi:hypothetical protein NQ318_007209 [Aromia moschata]|uniref:Ribosomal protein S10 n=1 Tax=Aromia moschata TaxID=1265417 RepID=A0AAV8Y896_9CUCU|nr:hypothetical protein NQ318_007209 [Aromia moschata]